MFFRKAQTGILVSCRFRRVLQQLADWRDRNQTVWFSQGNVMDGQRGFRCFLPLYIVVDISLILVVAATIASGERRWD